MIRFVLALLLIATPASADNILLLGAGGKKPSAAAAVRSYTLVGAFQLGTGSSATSYGGTVDTGTANSNRVILIATYAPFNDTTACTVNSDSATQILAHGTLAGLRFFQVTGTDGGSGNVTASCNRSANAINIMTVYRLENLASTTANQTREWSNASQAWTFNDDDFLFVSLANNVSGAHWNGSTEAPAHTCDFPAGAGGACSISGTGGEGVTGDWAIAAAYPGDTFTLTTSGGFYQLGVSYR